MDPIERALKKAAADSVSIRERSASSGRRAHRHRIVLKKSEDTEFLAPLEYRETKVQNVSHDVFQKNRLVAYRKTGSLSDIFRVLRAQVIMRLAAIPANTLGVCSAKPGEGKTLTACNLAISLALDPNFTVLLVDMDFRRPRVDQYFGVAVERGLCDFLEGNAEISECLINPGIERLVLLPIRRPVLNSSELLSSPRIRTLLAELKNRYEKRIIIYDLPPLLPTDDSLVVLPNMDASLLVLQEGETAAGEIQRCIDFLQDHNLLGTVLNKSTMIDIYPYY
jgi:capsular exopolysaccharide synthesis family protein